MAWWWQVLPPAMGWGIQVTFVTGAPHTVVWRDDQGRFEESGLCGRERGVSMVIVGGSGC